MIALSISSDYYFVHYKLSGCGHGILFRRSIIYKNALTKTVCVKRVIAFYNKYLLLCWFIMARKYISSKYR